MATFIVAAKAPIPAITGIPTVPSDAKIPFSFPPDLPVLSITSFKTSTPFSAFFALSFVLPMFSPNALITDTPVFNLPNPSILLPIKDIAGPAKAAAPAILTIKLCVSGLKLLNLSNILLNPSKALLTIGKAV